MQTVEDLFSVYARGFEAHRQAEMTLPGSLPRRSDDVCHRDRAAFVRHR